MPILKRKLTPAGKRNRKKDRKRIAKNKEVLGKNKHLTKVREKLDALQNSSPLYFKYVGGLLGQIKHLAEKNWDFELWYRGEPGYTVGAVAFVGTLNKKLKQLGKEEINTNELEELYSFFQEKYGKR